MARTGGTRRTSARAAGGSSRTSSRTSAAPAKKRGNLFVRGDEARGKVDEEIQRQKERSQGNYNPYNYRFFVVPGETKEIVILDDEPECFIYEHNLKNPRSGKWNVFIPCIKAFDNCPACDEVKESTYVMLLTVIDLTPYEGKSGTVEWSRKLMVVKPKQQKKFIRRFDKEGTLRGAIFAMSRDGDKEASIGEDIEFVEFMEEDELALYQREFELQGKKTVEDCSVPFDYEEIITEPTADDIVRAMGGEYSNEPRGNVDRDRRSLEEEETDDWNEEGGSNKPWKDDEEEAEEDEVEDEKPARRGARTTRRTERAPARTTGRRSRKDEDDAEEEEEPVRRSAASRTRSAGRTARRGR